MSAPKDTFGGRPIRNVYDTDRKERMFSAIDIVSALTEHPYGQARKHWSMAKARLTDAGNELTTKCCQLKQGDPYTEIRHKCPACGHGQCSFRPRTGTSTAFS